MRELWEREQKAEKNKDGRKKNEEIPIYEEQPKLNLKWAEFISTADGSNEEFTLNWDAMREGLNFSRELLAVHRCSSAVKKLRVAGFA